MGNRFIKIRLEVPFFESFILHQHYITILRDVGNGGFLPHHQYIKQESYEMRNNELEFGNQK